jgi:patatin-like phospholipase/acyl hydrolase
MIVSQNVTTDRTWFFVSHPNSKFFKQNSNIPLWHIARASSAAPTFFSPHSLEVSSGKHHEFVDGAMSDFNNPSFQLFLETTHQDYGINWETGADKLLMISIGTGFSNQTILSGKAKGYTLIDWAGYAVSNFMEEANIEQNLLMRMISKPMNSPTVEPKAADISLPKIDSIHQLKTGGSLGSTHEQLNSQLLTYHRHTISLTEKRFKKLKLSHIDPNSVSVIDCVARIPELCEIGQAVAEEQVRIENFEGFLNPDY